MQLRMPKRARSVNSPLLHIESCHLDWILDCKQLSIIAEIGHFRIHFSLYLKASLSAMSLVRVSLLILKLELITVTKISHLDSRWKLTDWREHRNGLLKVHSPRMYFLESIESHSFELIVYFFGYKTLKQTTGTMIPLVYVGSVVI